MSTQVDIYIKKEYNVYETISKGDFTKEFLLFSTSEKEKYKEEIFEMLKAYDDDFLPPLSKRNVNRETNRNTFSEERDEKNIRDYCNAMLREEVLGIFEGGTLCGFVSFA